MYLITFMFYSFEYVFVGGVGKAWGDSRLFVILKSWTHPLRTECISDELACFVSDLPVVEGITKWLMKADKIFPSHEYLN